MTKMILNHTQISFFLLTFFLTNTFYSQNVDLSNYNVSKLKEYKLSYNTFTKVGQFDYKGYSIYFDLNNFLEFSGPTYNNTDTITRHNLRQLALNKDTVLINSLLTNEKTLAFYTFEITRRVADRVANIQKTGTNIYERHLLFCKYETKNKTGCKFFGEFYFTTENVLLYDKQLGHVQQFSE